MNNINIGKEPIASLVWRREEKNGGITSVGVYEYVSDEGEVVVKLKTANSDAGIAAEYAFVNYRFPGYMVTMQSLLKASINGNHVMCDRLRIQNGEEEKHILFDISDFFGRS